MAFEKGNTAAAKAKLFDGALKRAIAQDDGKRLREAAEQLLNNASQGEPWALQMLADRLDGKPKQAVVGGDDGDEPIKLVFGWKSA